MKNGYCQINT